MNEEQRRKELRIKLNGVQGTPELWDISTGEVRPYPVYTWEEDGLVISYVFEPLETNCFRVKKRPHRRSTSLSRQAAADKYCRGRRAQGAVCREPRPRNFYSGARPNRWGSYWVWEGSRRLAAVEAQGGQHRIGIQGACCLRHLPWVRNGSWSCPTG